MPWTVVPFIRMVNGLPGGRRTAVTPKKLRSWKIAGGERTKTASAEDQGRGHEQETRLAADEEDQSADEEPAHAGLEADRVAFRQPDGQGHGDDRVRREPARRAREERRQVESATHGRDGPRRRLQPAAASPAFGSAAVRDASAPSARTSRSGYSQTPLKAIGATTATSELARTPPADITR